METDNPNDWNFSLPSAASISDHEVLVTTTNLNNWNGTTLTVEILMVEAANRKNFSPNYLPKPRAFQVNFSPCVRTYGNISYSNAGLSETILSTAMLPFIKDRYSLVTGSSFSPDIDCTPSDSPRGRKIQPTTSLANGLRYPNHQFDASSEPDTLYFDRACIYEYGLPYLDAVYVFFRRLIFGSGQSRQNKLTVAAGDNGLKMVGNEWLRTLWRNGTADIVSVTRFMDRVADAISAGIRDLGDVSNSAPFQGTVMGNETCVGVVWAWLALPAALLMFTLIFALLAGVRSGCYTKLGAAQDGRKPWKSSTLPLMWCGIEDWTRYQFPCFADIKDMETNADQIMVRLRRVVGGIRQAQTDELEYPRGRWVLQQEFKDDEITSEQ